MSDDGRWATADRLSDAIIDLVNKELKAMRAGDFNPLQLLMGQLLALKALTRTMPPNSDSRPAALLALNDAVDRVIFEMDAALERMESENRA